MFNCLLTGRSDLLADSTLCVMDSVVPPIAHLKISIEAVFLENKFAFFQHHKKGIPFEMPLK